MAEMQGTIHLLACTIGNDIFRDPEEHAMSEEEFEAFIAHRTLPRHYFAYHHAGEKHWQEVLKLPVHHLPMSLKEWLERYYRSLEKIRREHDDLRVS